MNRRTAILIATVTGILFAVSILWRTVGVDHRSSQSQSYSIVKAWWPSWDTFQIGVQAREEADQSFRTTFLQKDDYVPALNEFKKGGADGATLTIYEAILAASHGISIKIVLLLDYTMGSDGVVVKQNIRTLRDLKGKRLGVEFGTIAHFTIGKALEKTGLVHEDVVWINLAQAQLQQAFLRGEIDAVGTYEPFMSRLVREGNGHVIFSSREIAGVICDVLFVKEEVVRDHPEVIDHWIEAWSEVLKFKSSSPEEHLRNMNRLNGVSIAESRTAFEGMFIADLNENRVAFGTREKPGYLLESLKEMEDFMIREGVISQHLPLHDLIAYEVIHGVFRK